MESYGSSREKFFNALIGLVPRPRPGGPPVLIGIDGVDGAGKTSFADELRDRLSPLAHVDRVSVDGFHNTRDDRYRRGRQSAEGFWLDSYDYETFLGSVIEPIRAGAGTFLPAAHDVDTDAVLTGPRLPVVRGSFVVVDGIFLHRSELQGQFDWTLFLDVPFAVSVARMSRRDGSSSDPDAEENARYVGGQRIYLTQCSPADRADVHIDYGDLGRPIIVRPIIA